MKNREVSSLTCIKPEKHAEYHAHLTSPVVPPLLIYLILEARNFAFGRCEGIVKPVSGLRGKHLTHHSGSISIHHHHHHLFQHHHVFDHLPRNKCI